MDAHWAWVAAIGLGLFHGLNPGMGWLFAVSNGLQAGRGGAVWRALWPIGGGHLLAMAAVLVPVALLDRALPHDAVLQLGAALLLIGLLIGTGTVAASASSVSIGTGTEAASGSRGCV